MLTTPHTAAGIAIGSVVGAPLLVVPIAIASHFMLDMVPHWQETLALYIPTKKTYIRVPIDVIFSIGITLLAVYWQPHQVTSLLVGAISANLPDFDILVVLIPSLKIGLIKRFWDWHCKIQRETSSLWGVPLQLLVIVLGLLVAYKA